MWFDLMSDTRHWELEPYFDVDGGRGAGAGRRRVHGLHRKARPGGTGRGEARLRRVSGSIPPMARHRAQKKFSGDHFTGEPPDKAHDWVLHVVREGHLEGMNKSYKFESREIVPAGNESNTPKVPFAIEQPTGRCSRDAAAPYSAKITHETHATRSMMWLWIGEVAADGQGYRVLGTGQKGMLQCPPSLAKNFPAIMHLRLYGMNANGKVYRVDAGCGLQPVNPLILAMDTTHEAAAWRWRAERSLIEETSSTRPTGSRM